MGQRGNGQRVALHAQARDQPWQRARYSCGGETARVHTHCLICSSMHGTAAPLMASCSAMLVGYRHRIEHQARQRARRLRPACLCTASTSAPSWLLWRKSSAQPCAWQALAHSACTSASVALP